MCSLSAKVIEFFSVSHDQFILTSSCYNPLWRAKYELDYSLSSLYFAKSIPKFKFLTATSSSSSVKDFLPKLRNFIRSFLLNDTKSPSVSTSAAFKQFNALTDRSISTSLVLSNCLICNDSSSYDSVCAISSASSVILSSENNMKW